MPKALLLIKNPCAVSPGWRDGRQACRPQDTDSARPPLHQHSEPRPQENSGQRAPMSSLRSPLPLSSPNRFSNLLLTKENPGKTCVLRTHRRKGVRGRQESGMPRLFALLSCRLAGSQAPFETVPQTSSIKFWDECAELQHANVARSV